MPRRVPTDSRPKERAFPLPPDLAADILRLGKRCKAERGTVLFREGQATKGVYLIMSGRVALSTAPDPVRVTRIAEKGSLLGLPATLRNLPYTLTAEVVTEAEFCQVKPSVIRKFLKSNPEQCYLLLRILTNEIAAVRRLAVYKV